MFICRVEGRASPNELLGVSNLLRVIGVTKSAWGEAWLKGLLAEPLLCPLEEQKIGLS